MDDFTIHRKNLPHWRQSGALYFVTWRLHRMQTALRPEERTVVFDAIKHFEGIRHELGAYVVMDDHVHALVFPLTPYNLDGVLHTWRSFTANKLQRNHGRTGTVWQEEPYDHIVRDKPEFDETTAYVLNNPFKRWPEILEYRWVGTGTFSW